MRREMMRFSRDWMISPPRLLGRQRHIAADFMLRQRAAHEIFADEDTRLTFTDFGRR